MHRLFCIVDSQAQVDAILEGLYNDEDQAAVVARFKEHGAEKVAHFKKAVVEYL